MVGSCRLKVKNRDSTNFFLLTLYHALPDVKVHLTPKIVFRLIKSTCYSKPRWLDERPWE